MPTPRKSKRRAGKAGARKRGNLLEARGRFRKKAKPKELRERAAAATSYRRIREDLEGAPDHIERILRLISDNAFRQGFNVERVRHSLSLRSHDATTEFRRQTGATIGRYIEDRRLECAERLLLDTDLDFHQIAGLVGYGSFTTFSDAFDRRMGCRPRVYRESGGQGSRQEDLPRFPAGVASSTDARCARCGSDLEAAPGVRIFERLRPLCHPCARRYAPRVLAALADDAEPGSVTLLGRILRGRD